MELNATRKELTENQKSFVANKRSEYKDLFNAKQLFDEKTRLIRVPKEMFSQLKMRKWLSSSLLKIPFTNLNVDEETYRELVEQNCEDMEWGVVQKAISIILGLAPDFFGVDSEVESVYNCLHTKADEVKFCPRCDGGGYVKGVGNPKTEGELTLLSYSEMVKNLKVISNFITKEVGRINEEIKAEECVVLESIWYDKMSAGERHNANGEIERYEAQKQGRPVSKVNILKS